MLGKGALFLTVAVLGLIGLIDTTPAGAMSSGPVAATVRAKPARAHIRATPPTPVSPKITLHGSYGRVTFRRPLTLSGTVTGEVSAVKVVLRARPYPYTRPVVLATTTTASDGSYSFTVHPNRDTRYRTYVVGTNSYARATVTVVPKVITRVHALSLGRVKIVVVVIHPRNVAWRGAKVRWWFAPGRSHFFQGKSTTTRRLSPTKLVLVTERSLPAGYFKWRACFHAPGAWALGDPRRVPGCTGQGFRGHGRLPFGFPGPAAIARAERYLDSRGGHTALAVVDTEGRMHGVRINDQFITGSVVKAMLLVAYLRMLNARGQHYVDSNSNNILYPMIHVSDNNAATECWNIVGNSGLYAVASAAGMTHFSVDTSASWGGEWGAALLTAHDQAKFFFEMDSLIPREFVGYARHLLSNIASYEAWGIPTIARPLGYTVFFKGGWRPSPDTYLVHQIARLEKDGHRFSLAIMTDGDPDMGYGIDTIQGTTQALLG